MKVFTCLINYTDFPDFMETTLYLWYPIEYARNLPPRVFLNLVINDRIWTRFARRNGLFISGIAEMLRPRSIDGEWSRNLSEQSVYSVTRLISDDATHGANWCTGTLKLVWMLHALIVRNEWEYQRDAASLDHLSVARSMHTQGIIYGCSNFVFAGFRFHVLKPLVYEWGCVCHGDFCTACGLRFFWAAVRTLRVREIGRPSRTMAKRKRDQIPR